MVTVAQCLRLIVLKPLLLNYHLIQFMLIKHYVSENSWDNIHHQMLTIMLLLGVLIDLWWYMLFLLLHVPSEDLSHVQSSIACYSQGKCASYFLIFHLIMLLGTSAKIVDSKMFFRVIICFVESKANTLLFIRMHS